MVSVILAGLLYPPPPTSSPKCNTGHSRSGGSGRKGGFRCPGCLGSGPGTAVVPIAVRLSEPFGQRTPSPGRVRKTGMSGAVAGMFARVRTGRLNGAAFRCRNGEVLHFGVERARLGVWCREDHAAAQKVRDRRSDAGAAASSALRQACPSTTDPRPASPAWRRACPGHHVLRFGAPCPFHRKLWFRGSGVAGPVFRRGDPGQGRGSPGEAPAETAPDGTPAEPEPSRGLPKRPVVRSGMELGVERGARFPGPDVRRRGHVCHDTRVVRNVGSMKREARGAVNWMPLTGPDAFRIAEPETRSYAPPKARSSIGCTLTVTPFRPTSRRGHPDGSPRVQ